MHLCNIYATLFLINLKLQGGYTTLKKLTLFLGSIIISSIIGVSTLSTPNVDTGITPTTESEIPTDCKPLSDMPNKGN